MFNCEICKKTSKAGEKQYKIIVEAREVVYENGTKGWEIVKEISVCETCSKRN